MNSIRLGKEFALEKCDLHTKVLPTHQLINRSPSTLDCGRQRDRGKTKPWLASLPPEILRFWVTIVLKKKN